MTIELSSARPTLQDGRTFAVLFNQAADGFPSTMLGRDYPNVIARGFVHPGHDLSYEYVTFAKRNTAVVGMVSGYTAEQHRASTVRHLARAAGWRVVRASVVAAMNWTLLRFMDKLSAGDFYLQAIAVNSESRGRGVGAQLMSAMVERARNQRSKRLVLDVSIENDRAQKLYRRFGMRIISISPKNYIQPDVRVYRMAKPL